MQLDTPLCSKYATLKVTLQNQFEGQTRLILLKIESDVYEIGILTILNISSF